MNNEIIDRAISNIEGMIKTNIQDMSRGAVYVRTEGPLCLKLFDLVDRLESMRTPAKKVVKK